MKDAIIAEVWRNRDMLSARYGHDLDAIVAAMKKRQGQTLTKTARREKPNCQAHSQLKRSTSIHRPDRRLTQ